MSEYRKKPVVIEAVQYLGNGNLGELPPPAWLWKALDEKIAVPTNGGDPFVIHTLEGDHIASPGDWIIKGIKGELYPCKPDIFEATYEEVSDSPHDAWQGDEIIMHQEALEVAFSAAEYIGGFYDDREPDEPMRKFRRECCDALATLRAMLAERSAK